MQSSPILLFSVQSTLARFLETSPWPLEISHAQRPAACMRSFQNSPPDLLILDAQAEHVAASLLKAILDRPMGSLVPCLILDPIYSEESIDQWIAQGASEVCRRREPFTSEVFDAIGQTLGLGALSEGEGLQHPPQETELDPSYAGLETPYLNKNVEVLDPSFQLQTRPSHRQHEAAPFEETPQNGVYPVARSSHQELQTTRQPTKGLSSDPMSSPPSTHLSSSGFSPTPLPPRPPRPVHISGTGLQSAYPRSSNPSNSYARLERPPSSGQEHGMYHNDLPSRVSGSRIETYAPSTSKHAVHSQPYEDTPRGSFDAYETSGQQSGVYRTVSGYAKTRSGVYEGLGHTEAARTFVSGEEVRRKLHQTRHEDYFSILGVRKGASQSDVNDAYAAVSKRFDSGMIGYPLMDQYFHEVREIQEAIEDAFAVLSHRESREEYLRAIMRHQVS